MRVSKAEYGDTVQFLFYTGSEEIGEISLTKVPGGYEISNVLVWVKFQRKGFGTKFYRHAWEFARSQGKKLFRSDDRTDAAKQLHKTFKFAADGREIVFESSAYQRLNLEELKRLISTGWPVYDEKGQYGFDVKIVDRVTAEIFWRNTFGEANHADLISELKNYLSANGFEVRVKKPARTSLIARKVFPYVFYGEVYGPFELTVDRITEDDNCGAGKRGKPGFQKGNDCGALTAAYANRHAFGKQLASDPNIKEHVLGRLHVTSRLTADTHQSILNTNKWSLAVNDGWLDAAIENKRQVKFAHPVKDSDLTTQVYDRKSRKIIERPNILHREVTRLKKAGYQPKYDENGHIVAMQPPGDSE